MLCDSYRYNVTRELIVEQHTTYPALATADTLTKATKLMFLDSCIAAGMLLTVTIK